MSLIDYPTIATHIVRLVFYPVNLLAHFIILYSKSTFINYNQVRMME